MHKPPPNIAFSGFSDAEIRNAQTNGKLLSITLLLGDQCNLKCLYCYRDAGKKENHELNIADWKSILLQAKDLGAKNVWIPGSGEPMLDINFFNGENYPILEICKELNLTTTFFTNGTYFTDANLEKLRHYKTSVITKLNSFQEDTQDYLAGEPSISKRIYQGLNLLIKHGLNKYHPTRLGIDTVITAFNYEEIEEIFKHCRENNIIPYITANLHGGRAVQNPQLDVNKEMLQNIFNKVLAIDQDLYGYSWIPAPPIIAGNCKRLLYDIVVDYKGNVLLCPGIDISLGNIRNNNLNEIIKTSDLLKKIRGLPSTLNGACGICKNPDCAYGCRLEALAVNNDLFSSDPLCWH